MQLLQVTSPAGGRRYYLDGRRVAMGKMDNLKSSYDQDTFKTVCRGETVLQYSQLRLPCQTRTSH